MTVSVEVAARLRAQVGPARAVDVDADDQAELAAVLLANAGRFRDLTTEAGRDDVRLAMEISR